MTLLGPRSRAVPGLAALLLAGVPLGCKQAAAPPEDKPPPAIVTWKGASENLLKEWTELVGTTMPLPDRVAQVTAPVGGQVLTVLTGAGNKPVAEGQPVVKGTVLVQLDDTILKANLAKLEAAQDVFPEELKQAEYAVEGAKLDVERLRRLQEGEGKGIAGVPGSGAMPLVSAIEREKAAIALKDAQAKLQASRRRQAAGAKEVEALQKQLPLYTLAAPIPGRVGRILVAPGQTLAVGAAVAEVVDIEDQIDVLCFVPPSVVGRLRVGQTALSGPVEKDPDAAAPVEAQGRIEYIADQAESETGNFAVKVRFPNKEAHLRANRVLRIRVLTRPGRECLSLPEAAVMEDEVPPTVVVVENVKTETNKEGKEETTGLARRLQVELGVRDRNLRQVEILRLIDPEKDPAKKWHGDLKDALFVVAGGQGVQTGDTVKLEVETE
jgi:multidrug efflux pump subunit AcrA (membrane-fusion protein)